MQFSCAIRAAVAALVVAAAGLGSPASAQEWPAKPIRVILGFGAGGGTDIVTRIIAQPLSELLGQPVVVDNKPGAGGTIAGDLVAKAAKDGYTGSMLSAGHTVSAVMYKSLPYDSLKDFAPVAIVANSAFLIVAHKDFPADDIKGLVAAARDAPDKFKVGTVGLGSTQHFTAELLLQRTGIKLKHIPYRRTPELVAALRAKEVDIIVEPLHTVIGQVQAGDFKAIAVASGKRWPAAPEIPTAMEQGVPDYDVVGWYGFAFPAGTPAPIVDKMNKSLKDVLSRDGVREQIKKVGALASVSTPDEFSTLLASEVAKWDEVRKKAGIEPK